MTKGSSLKEDVRRVVLEIISAKLAGPMSKKRMGQLRLCACTAIWSFLSKCGHVTFDICTPHPRINDGQIEVQASRNTRPPSRIMA